MSSNYHKSFDPFGEHTEQRAQIQQNKSWASHSSPPPFFFFLYQLLSPSFLTLLIPWWHSSVPTGHALILPLNCDELSSFLYCYNSIPMMLHRVKNLNSALINLILQQKPFMIINIFSSWMSFHVFLFHSEGSCGQIPVTHSTPKTKMWLMSSSDCIVNVLLSPSSNCAEVTYSFPNWANHSPGGNISSLSLHWSSQEMLIARFCVPQQIYFPSSKLQIEAAFLDRTPWARALSLELKSVTRKNGSKLNTYNQFLFTG